MAFNHRKFLKSIAPFLLLWCATLVKADESIVYRTAYFQDLPFWESPLQPLKVSQPISQSKLGNKHYVQVGYDQLNRPIEIQIRQNNQFKSLGHFFQSMYVHAVHTRITYHENLEIHRFFDQHSNQITGWGDVWEKIYQKDEFDDYIKLYFKDKAGNRIENQWGIFSYTWQHQQDGSVIESRHSQSGELKPHRPGFEFERIRMVFSSDGQLRLMQNIDPDGKLKTATSGASQYRYYYFPNGQFKRWEVLNQQGLLTQGPTRTAGEYYSFPNQNQMKISFFDPQLKPTLHQSGAVHWLLEFDQFDNIKRLSFFDESEQLINGQMGYAYVEYQWDRLGYYLLSQKYFGPNGKPIQHMDGFYQIEYLYNQQQQLIEKRFLDLDNRLVKNSYEQAMQIIYHYDKQGRLEKTSKQ